MKAARIHRFGPPDVIAIDDLPVPTPPSDEVLIRTTCAGVGPWDALIREHKSKIEAPLPIILGSDLSGIVEAAGSAVAHLRPGDAVYGVTNPLFIGAYAEFALASARMIARKPATLTFAQAASVPVVAVTAWQMLFDYAQAKRGQNVLIHGAGGNVGAYAVQLAKLAGLDVIATAAAHDAEYVTKLGARTVVDYEESRFESVSPPVDIVLDTVGGDVRERSYPLIKPGGVLVSVVSEPPHEFDRERNVRSVFFLVEVTTNRLNKITHLFEQDKLTTRVGTELPLNQARTAHDMLAGAPHKPGKIVLKMGR